jgi:hypothetical protein
VTHQLAADDSKLKTSRTKIRKKMKLQLSLMMISLLQLSRAQSNLAEEGQICGMKCMFPKDIPTNAIAVEGICVKQGNEGVICSGMTPLCRDGHSCVYPKDLIHITPITEGVCVKDGSDGGRCGDMSPPCNAGLSCVFPKDGTVNPNTYGLCVKDGDEGGKCGGLTPNGAQKCNDGLICMYPKDFPPNAIAVIGVCEKPTSTTSSVTDSKSASAAPTRTVYPSETTSQISSIEDIVTADASVLSALGFAGFIALLFF